MAPWHRLADAIDGDLNPAPLVESRRHHSMKLARIFGRGFLIVGLQACSVVAVSAHSLPAAFVSSGAISWVWWVNTQTANRADFYGARVAYCAGAACGSALVAWLTAVH